MRPPASIKNWLSIQKLFDWLQHAPDSAAHQRRMAIWLTHTGKLHADKVAAILGVSKQSVWMWIRQYNQKGPDGLDRNGRGGRRWALMSVEEETAILRPLMNKVRAGRTPKTEVIQRIIETHLQQKVSTSYIYKLLNRHGWTELLRRSRGSAQVVDSGGTFAAISKPWQRD